jgi:hypothetical protein
VRRDKAWLKLQEKKIRASGHVVKSEGEGYVPPHGKVPALAVSQTAKELRAFLDRE